ADFAAAACQCINGRRRLAERWIRDADKIEHIGIKIKTTRRDEIDDGNANALSKQRGALRGERPTALRPILVARADELDCRYQKARPLLIENEHFIGILVAWVGGYRKRWLRGSPDRRRDPTI